MATLQRYTNFEDLKNSGLSDQARTPADIAEAKARQKKWLAQLKAAGLPDTRDEIHRREQPLPGGQARDGGHAGKARSMIACASIPDGSVP